jgi:hypothetical protein
MYFLPGKKAKKAGHRCYDIVSEQESAPDCRLPVHPTSTGHYRGPWEAAGCIPAQN